MTQDRGDTVTNLRVTSGRYEVIEANKMIGLLCRRCPSVLVTASPDKDGDGVNQVGLTLADLIEQAEGHEAENHA